MITALKWVLPIVGCIIPAAGTLVAFCVCYLYDTHYTDQPSDAIATESTVNDSDDATSDTYSHTSSDIDFFYPNTFQPNVVPPNAVISPNDVVPQNVVSPTNNHLYFTTAISNNSICDSRQQHRDGPTTVKLA